MAACLGLLGFFFALWSNLALLRQGRGGPTDLLNVAISPRTKRLVTSAPYAYTRNPMVFGMLCVYLALALYLDSWPAFLAVIAFALVVRLYVLPSEEQRLSRDFGQQYQEYRRRVPMLVPWPFRRNSS
ncbi:MAG: isoprenylcysteine carboxylmethyltransferase family protein [Desulfarculus sp.]|nr:isoprenylcysteine carboxylmethyltransferase family protein [Desulfarculus sp.]